MPDIPMSIQQQQPNLTIEAMQKVAQNEKIELTAEANESKKSLMEAQETAVNPFAAARQTARQPIKTRKDQIKELMKGSEAGKKLLPIEHIKDMAGQFQKRNPELRSNVLVLLREYIKTDDTKEDILRKLLEFYPDPSLADEALEFLLATTEGELHTKISEAKDEFVQKFSREIIAGKNITALAQQASEKGLGTPSTLRDLYRDITGNPRDTNTLFEELSGRYNYKELKKVTDFLLHSLGSDMKSKGPSIEPGQLHTLFTETRSLQAALGVFKFFKGRMNLMEGMYEREGRTIPQQLSFESMSKQFMALASQSYPSPSMVTEGAARLGANDVSAKIIVITQFRDAIREVSAKTVPFREKLFIAIIESLEDLEDQMEELEDAKLAEADLSSEVTSAERRRAGAGG